MKNYDIGILSFWNVPNYGTFAQEYALQKAIAYLRNDRDVRQIAHLDELHSWFYFDLKSYYRSFPVYTKAHWKSYLPIKDADIKQKQKVFFDAYRSIPHTDDITRNNLKDYSFESVVLGSDIVWDYTQYPFNNDPLLFGKGFNSKYTSSYAASFGMAKITSDIPEYVKESLNNLDFITVRDENSADMVEHITGKRPEKVLDPVWLWNFNEDKNISEPEERDYILVYGQDFTDKFIENLVSFSKKKHLKTIVLDCHDDNYSWCDKLIRQSELHPLQWIGYFKGASAIATSTFHGLTFGLVFKKPIAFCKSDFIMAKIESLLSKIELIDLFEDKNDVQRMLSYNWNYENIDVLLNEERNKSLDLLNQAVR
ncbi:MAG: polysaccharide pyruvyl transferase family protein [Oscillospiraceae bacterium]|nr:polysaccharide pyruvyl transferase family protein [Oscillospiraceae bacterium]